jgi:hypothetical protein
MSDPVVPIGAFINTPINRSIAGATAIGFNAGAAGAVTQLTSKTTGVTLNTRTGVITTHNSTMGGEGGDTLASFTLTNDKIHATDLVVVNQGAGGTAGAYMIQCLSVTDGSAIIAIYLADPTGGDLSEAVKINFAVIDTVAAV